MNKDSPNVGLMSIPKGKSILNGGGVEQEKLNFFHNLEEIVFLILGFASKNVLFFHIKGAGNGLVM